jgi:Tol biopolymer transport system component
VASITRVTADSGLTTSPAVAPNGSLLAYASDRGGGNLNIWVQPLPDGQSVQVTHDDVDATEPNFSRDGSRIVLRSERSGGGIYVVPALGGAERFIVAKGRHPQFSPDGKSIAYLSGGRGASSEVWVVDDGGGVDASVDWWLINVQTGTATAMSAVDTLKRAGLDAGPDAWVAGKIIFSASDGGVPSLWAIDVSSDGRSVTGSPRRLTAGVGVDFAPSVITAADGLTIYYANQDKRANLCRLPLSASPGVATLDRLTDAAATDRWPSLSADGRTLVFGSNRSSGPSVWLRDLASSRETPLTAADAVNPTVSPDGQRAVYLALSQNSDRMVMRAVGGGATESLPGDVGWAWSWPSAHVLLSSRKAGDVTELVVVDPATRQARSVLAGLKKGFYGHGQLSPDGRWASAMQWESADQARIIIFPFRDTPVPPSEWVALTDDQTVEEEHVWSPRGDAIYFVSERDGNRCLWMRKLDPATRHPVGPVMSVLHLHGARRSMIPTAESPQRIALGANALFFSVQEARGNIWKATLKGK